MKIETGVMIVKDGLGWGVDVNDGKNYGFGWVSIDDAEIHDPKYLKKPTDATYKGSSDEDELKKGEIVPVTRVTRVYTFPKV
jgi:hypothetical protein